MPFLKKGKIPLLKKQGKPWLNLGTPKTSTQGNVKYLPLFFFLKRRCSFCVKARPSDPLVYVWILWCLFSVSWKLLSRTSCCTGNKPLEINNPLSAFIGWRSVIPELVFFTWRLPGDHLRQEGLRVGKTKLRTFNPFFASRGVRKVTTGITGLWRRSVQSDAAFWFFDVGSSYPVLASGHKGKFVHLPTGNVSWV